MAAHNQEYGSQSEVGEIRKLLLKHPKDAFCSGDSISSQWKNLHYDRPPDYKKSIKEYDNFATLLRDTVPEIHYLPATDNTGLDSLYTHDPVIITKKGAILCNMGKNARRGEPQAVKNFLAGLDIPIFGAVTGDGRLEGGDVVWIDERTLAVGLGYRTNAEGIRQLKEMTSELTDEFVIVPLPHWEGPGDVMHLMSIISPIDYDLALVYSRLLTVQFRNWLIDRGIKLLEAPDSEYASMACNVLTVAPRRCIMLSGNPITKKLLENAGVEVREYKGDEISKKGFGGPTCLTRPLLRL